MEPVFQNIRHYVFDLYGTLVDIRTDEDKPSFWEALAVYFSSNGANYSLAELRQCYRIESERVSTDCIAQHPEFTFHEIDLATVFARLYALKGVAAGSGLIADTALRFRQASTEFIRTYDGAQELLTALRKRGHVWLLSNAQSLFTRPELDLLGLTSFFDGIYISSECSCKKPDRMFYRALLDGQNIAPEEAVMIGNDGSSDICGGREAGMKTVYLRSDISPDEPFPEADFIMEKLDLVQLRRVLTEY